MDANRWQRIRALLEAARELPADQRAAFLTTECGSDEALRLEVQSLLEADREASSFLKSVANEETVDSRSVSPESGSVSIPATIGVSLDTLDDASGCRRHFSVILPQPGVASYDSTLVPE